MSRLRYRISDVDIVSEADGEFRKFTLNDRNLDFKYVHRDSDLPCSLMESRGRDEPQNMLHATEEMKICDCGVSRLCGFDKVHAVKACAVLTHLLCCLPRNISVEVHRSKVAVEANLSWNPLLANTGFDVIISCERQHPTLLLHDLRDGRL